MATQQEGGAHVLGKLYVVATPIGNLDDLTSRARQILASVDWIASEDTRHTGRLLARLGVDTRQCSLHEHNETARSAGLLERLRAGEDVALVSDAGTPLVADPGFELVRAARAEAIELVPVPGPSAAIAALSVAGLPTDRFVFEGFLPPRAGARKRRLDQLAREPRTLVLYEAPHRIEALLATAAEAFGWERNALLARELTKRFEETRHAPLGRLAAAMTAGELAARGEFVLVVAGAAAGQEGTATSTELDVDALLDALLAELSVSRACRVAARVTSIPRRTLYRRALTRSRA